VAGFSDVGFQQADLVQEMRKGISDPHALNDARGRAKIGPQCKRTSDTHFKSALWQRAETIVRLFPAIQHTVVIVVSEIRVEPTHCWANGKVEKGSEVIFDFRPEKTLFDTDLHRHHQQVIGFVRKVAPSKSIDEGNFPLIFPTSNT